MDEIILLKLGELVLKGQNRRAFEQKLISTIRHKISKCGTFKVYSMQSAIYAEPLENNCDMDSAYEAMRNIFGIVSVSRAAACRKDPEVIIETAKEYLYDRMMDVRSFKVESKRADKSFKLNSIQLSQEIGGKLHDAFPHIRVDVHNPELTVNIEIRDHAAYIHGGGETGAGGLPLGTSGRAAVLLSGGIDSPVALWMMAKRGMTPIPVHFAAPPYTSQLAREKVLKLAEILLPYCDKLCVEIVPFTEIQEEIKRKCPEEYFTIIMRRCMMRITEQVARANGCTALVTGESLGQVASQTAEAIGVTEAVCGLPVLRPCIGLDKEEITRIARRIGTFETSILPYEDCCTVFTPKHPKTRPKLADVESVESILDMPGLCGTAYAAIERVHITDR